MDLKLSNTLGNKKEPFVPLEDGIVRMYHCGPTVKEHINIDKFRSFLLADILRRTIEYSGLEVVQVMNITDVGHLNEFEEDAVEIAAGRCGKQPMELVEEEEAEFHRHRHALGILDAHHYPRARENIADMVKFVAELLEAGVAYRAGENVYFDITRFNEFGKLSGKSLDELTALHKTLRAEPHPEKRHPLDIDLWRTDALRSMHWPSPWGRGFPGWHIECVVMGRKFLGDTFDIHTGSQEIVYPHHECEIAQAEACGTPLARFWLHSGHILVGGKPTSRTNRNLLTVQGLLDSGVSGLGIRGALLSEHYREPIEFTPGLLDRTREQRGILQAAADKLAAVIPAPTPSAADQALLEKTEAAFRAAVDDDLDYPRALRTAVGLAEKVNNEEVCVSASLRETLKGFDSVLGLVE